MALSFKEVAEIVKIIDASNCEELVLESEGTRLVVRRGTTPQTDTSPSKHSAEFSPQSREKSASHVPLPAASTGAHDQSRGAGDPPDGVMVNAPIVGNFFRRPAPDKEPYVDIGTRVSVGDPLCMIEVMKLYTTIASDVSGVVEAILADDTKLVEFDQPLFVIRPDQGG